MENSFAAPAKNSLASFKVHIGLSDPAYALEVERIKVFGPVFF
jgi:hypothetical protein